MKMKKQSLMLLISLLILSIAASANVTIDSFRSFNKSNTDFVFEAKISGNESYNYSIDYNDGNIENGTLDADYVYFTHQYVNSGPKNVSLNIVSSGSSDFGIIESCVPGTEIPDNGIDEDCDGVDFEALKVNILSPEPVQDSTNLREILAYDINVSTTKPANYCNYEFGKQRYLNNGSFELVEVTDTGSIPSVNSTYFQLLNYKPQNETHWQQYNYLKVSCNSTDDNKVYSKNVHVEFDYIFPGAVTNLSVSSGHKIDTKIVSFMLPGDDGDLDLSPFDYAFIYILHPKDKFNYSANDEGKVATWTYVVNLTSDCRPYGVKKRKGNIAYCEIDYFNRTHVNSTTQEITRVENHVAVAVVDNSLRRSAISNNVSTLSNYWDCEVVNTTNTKINKTHIQPNTSFYNYYPGEFVNFTATIRNNGETHPGNPGAGCWVRSSNSYWADPSYTNNLGPDLSPTGLVVLEDDFSSYPDRDSWTDEQKSINVRSYNASVNPGSNAYVDNFLFVNLSQNETFTFSQVRQFNESKPFHKYANQFLASSGLTYYRGPYTYQDSPSSTYMYMGWDTVVNNDRKETVLISHNVTYTNLTSLSFMSVNDSLGVHYNRNSEDYYGYSYNGDYIRFGVRNLIISDLVSEVGGDYIESDLMSKLYLNWIPVKIHSEVAHAMCEGGWAIPLTFGIFDSRTNSGDYGQQGLPDDFNNYECDTNSTDYCYKPHVPRVSGNLGYGMVDWYITNGEPGCPYNVWMEAGRYVDEPFLVNSSKVSILYG